MGGDDWTRPPHGADRRARTADLLVTNQLLYRLSYTGVCALRGMSTTTQGL